ncbi:MAG: hypothetical protein H8E40_09815 [Chloroflexi bacterium]|nr:hypothetical protein [Chloroflexota bacterium]
MIVSDLQAKEGFYAFLNQYGDTRAKQEVLMFWALHPNAQFGKLALLSAMECTRLEVKKALDDMVEDKLVEIHCNSGVVTYSLTSNDEIRQMVTLLRTFDWSQRQLLFRHAHTVNCLYGAIPEQGVS